MAGKADNPEARAKRDKASGRAARAPKEQAPRRIYGRVVPQDEQVVLVASAARINLNDRKALENTRRRRQAWQTEAWDYYDEIGESGFTVDFGGNLLSKIRLFAAVRPDAHDEPVPVDDEAAGVDAATAQLCVDTLARLRSAEGGQSALVREATINFDVAGEFYLHGHEDPETAEEDWQIRSVDELVVTGNTFALRFGPSGNTSEPIPGDDLVIRMWQRHPRFSQLATCAMRRVLGEAESLLLLSREIRAVSKSRLSNGLLLIPSEISFKVADRTRDPNDGEATDNAFEDSLTTAMVTSIQQEGSAAAVVPLVIRAPAEYLADIRHVELQKGLDPTLDARIEGRVLRLARGLNFPVETTTGLAATTFANAATVKKSEWDAHGQPRAVLLCDVLTAGYFQPALEEAGVPADQVRRYFIWFDPTDAISAPDPVDNVRLAHEDGIVSDETRRRIQGFSEADKPDDAELLRRIIFHNPRLDPFILGQLLQKTGLVPDIEIAAPINGILAEDHRSVLAESVPVKPAAPTAPAPTAPAPTTAAAFPAPARGALAAGAGGGGPLGRKLAQIDRDLRGRLQAAAEAAMQRALERAGNRIKSKAGYARRTGDATAAKRIANGVAAAAIGHAVGPSLVAALGLTDEELLSDSFDTFASDFDHYVSVAQAQAISTVEQVVGPLDQPVKAALAMSQATNREAAQAQIVRNMVALAGQRLYSPMPGAAGALGEADPAATVPVSVIRAALATAGGVDTTGGVEDGATRGSPLMDSDTGGPAGGVGTGVDIMGLVAAQGGAVEGYEWEYGGAVRFPFQPHQDLDGVQFVNFDDPALANPDSFPEVPYYMPGDHDGCFPAGTVVSGPAPRAATLRWYEGTMVELSFASGEFLAATANHPVLTDRGWVPAHLLQEGDHVVRCLDAERIAGLVPGDHQMPALIEEVVGSFRERGGMAARAVKVAAENFHGDGAGSEVAVVWADGLLGDGAHASLGEPAGEHRVGRADPDPSPLPRQSGGAELLPGVRSAPLGLEGVSCHSPAPFRGPGVVDEPLGLAVGSDPDAALPEPLSDSHPVHAESLGQSLDGLAGSVQLDKVINVSRRELWSGHVYNLETATSWYMANGILVHNCTCDFIPTIVFVAESPAGDNGPGADQPDGGAATDGELADAAAE